MDFDDLRNGFEEFQNGRQWCDDLHGRFPDDVQPGSKGWLYCGGKLWIEDTSTWPEDAPGYGEGKWYLRIGNMERQSDELTELEEPLYDYAKSEDLVA
jgi:hypothetical protein